MLILTLYYIRHHKCHYLRFDDVIRIPGKDIKLNLEWWCWLLTHWKIKKDILLLIKREIVVKHKSILKHIILMIDLVHEIKLGVVPKIIKAVALDITRGPRNTCNIYIIFLWTYDVCTLCFVFSILFDCILLNI